MKSYSSFLFLFIAFTLSSSAFAYRGRLDITVRKQQGQPFPKIGGLFHIQSADGNTATQGNFVADVNGRASVPFEIELSTPAAYVTLWAGGRLGNDNCSGRAVELKVFTSSITAVNLAVPCGPAGSSQPVPK